MMLQRLIFVQQNVHLHQPGSASKSSILLSIRTNIISLITKSHIVTTNALSPAIMDLFLHQFTTQCWQINQWDLFVINSIKSLLQPFRYEYLHSSFYLVFQPDLGIIDVMPIAITTSASSTVVPSISSDVDHLKYHQTYFLGSSFCLLLLLIALSLAAI